MWAILVLSASEIILFAANYSPGTFLAGWDNSFPDLNFWENLYRNIFGVWQTYRGLGLYDGMSHAAGLLHTLFIGALSLILPLPLHRYIFIFFMHFLGGLGMFLLLKKLLQNPVVSLTGALFYLFNLVTIQIFFTPYEAFAIHFASLPWLVLGAQTSLRLFSVIAFLASPQFFIPTLITPITILIVFIKKSLRFWLAFLVINAFWLLPFLYGFAQNAPIIAGSKINQMSSEEAYLRNHEFGNIADVLRLRGYTLNFEDYGPKGNVVYLMQNWRQFLANPAVDTISWIVVAIFLFGVATVLFRQKKEFFPFLIPLGISFFMLGNDIPGLREVIGYLRNSVPFFGEAFRYPFTKFGLLFAFSYTIFFSVAIKEIKQSIVAIVLILFLALPVFSGNFVSQSLRVSIPNEYFQLFTFMNSLPADGRIAILPQHTFWSWKLYRWGYRGSGFLWFGLRQPILDRAFDPWSIYNENYYWELSRALYSKDQKALTAVFQKYDVRYILLDENFKSTSDDRSLFINETKDLLATMPMITKVTQFGNLSLYENTAVQTKNFTRFATNLPTVSPVYRWTDNDVAYQQLGDYISGHSYFSLFTKRSISEREFDPTEIPKALVYDSQNTEDLIAKNILPCSIKQSTGNLGENRENFLRFTSNNERSCLSFGVANLEHKNGYLVEVTSRHLSGRALNISFINNTAHHSELETKLLTDGNWQTSNFILPPLAPDGLGYTVYLSNDAIAPDSSINDIGRIRFYTIPYRELVTTRLSNNQDSKNSVFILSQSYDPGWVSFPLRQHVLVNNWENGWILQTPDEKLTVFFLPQLLEWLGFLLLPLPFLYTWKYGRPNSSHPR